LISLKILPKYFGQTNVTLYAESNDWEVTGSKQLSPNRQCNIRNTEWSDSSCIRYCTEVGDFDEGLAFDRSGSFVTFRKDAQLIKYQVNGDFTVGSRVTDSLPAGTRNLDPQPPIKYIAGVTGSSSKSRSAMSDNEEIAAVSYPYFSYQKINSRGAIFFYGRGSNTASWNHQDTFFGTRSRHYLGYHSMKMINDYTLEVVSHLYKYDYIIQKLVSILSWHTLKVFIISLLTYN
jgi:hypothetical protein